MEVKAKQPLYVSSQVNMEEEKKPIGKCCFLELITKTNVQYFLQCVMFSVHITVNFK